MSRPRRVSTQPHKSLVNYSGPHQDESNFSFGTEYGNSTVDCWDYQTAIWLEDRPQNYSNIAMWQIYLALSQFIMRVVPAIMIATLNIWMFLRLRTVLKTRYSQSMKSGRSSMNVRLSQAWQTFSDRLSISSRRYTMNSSISSLVTQVGFNDIGQVHNPVIPFADFRQQAPLDL